MTDQSMITRVARAICFSRISCRGEWIPTEDLVEDLYRSYIPEAKAALSAMLEPTGGMLNDPGVDVGEKTMRKAWVAMIRKAMEEE